MIVKSEGFIYTTLTTLPHAIKLLSSIPSVHSSAFLLTAERPLEQLGGVALTRLARAQLLQEGWKLIPTHTIIFITYMNIAFIDLMIWYIDK